MTAHRRLAFVLAAASVALASCSSSGSPLRLPSSVSSITTAAPTPTSPSSIPGVVHRNEPNRNHVDGLVTYDTSPPIGGNHNYYWADCTGTVYPEPIANENAVHMLEHGAVWVTYRQGLPADQIQVLAGQINGLDYTALSPYPGLRTAVSLQAWGYQLFVTDVHDPRIATFINYFRQNPKTTPEYGATCSQPSFKLSPSTFGHPKSGPS